jgi:HEXXH motif-containing protein
VQPIVGYCGAALGLLSRRAPDLAAAVGGLVAALVVAARRGTGAASSSAAIGAIHLCPRSKWPVTKYAELFVHEYVHQALFLDECVHGMFAGSADELDGAAAQVISAVRKVPRGYDKSFHAAYVAYVQRRLYERLGEPDPAPVGPLDRTLGELTERAGWLTDHGRRRLTELVDLDRAHPAG